MRSYQYSQQLPLLQFLKCFKMSGEDQLCIIQNWALQQENRTGILHLRAKNTGQRIKFRISFRDNDFALAKAMYKRYRTFFLKPWMKHDNLIHYFNHGSAFKSHQNKDYAVKSQAFKMAMEQIEQLKTKNQKIEQECKNKCQKANKDKDQYQKKWLQQLENNRIQKMAESLRRNREEELEQQVRRLKQINEHFLRDLCATQPNNGQNREQEELFFGYIPRI